MTNNDILRRIRYSFNYNDVKMMSVFAEADSAVTRKQVSHWLKRDEDPDYQECSDEQLATFLNGLINLKRGKRDGEQPKPEKHINNNIVFKKLKIALNLKSDDILEILSLVDIEISNNELSAFFRSKGQKNFRPCKDQILRNFLQGLQLKYRPAESEETTDLTEIKKS